jgi:hypothetical protein
MRRASPAAAALATAVALLTSGCSGESYDAPAVCDDLDSVRVAVEHLQNANVSENGLDQVRTDLNRLRDQLTALADESDGQFQVQIDAVRDAAADLRGSVSAAKAESATSEVSAEALDAVSTSVVAVRDAVRDLGIVMTNTC